jgi:hypothetical protein
MIVTSVLVAALVFGLVLNVWACRDIIRAFSLPAGEESGVLPYLDGEVLDTIE